MRTSIDGAGIDSTRVSEGGFVLLAAAVSMGVIVGFLGLTVDVGRLYVADTELQRFADAAAMGAAYELDGSSAGISRAQSIVQNGFGTGAKSNAWSFESRTITNASVAFSTAFAGPYVASPSSASGVIFANVSVTQWLPLYFLPVISSVNSTRSITAYAIAGQHWVSGLGDGLAPFSPDAHNASDPNFGFTRGTRYTLKWPPAGRRKNSGCAGDANFVPAGGSSDRGLLDVGQGSGNSGLVSVIVSNDFFLNLPLTIGSALAMVSGNHSISGPVQTRFNQDTDSTATDFAHYAGNGRRLLIVAVNNHTDASLVAGFAAFFLPPSPCGGNNTSACCGEYVGAALLPGRRGGSPSGGLYVANLFQ